MNMRSRCDASALETVYGAHYTCRRQKPHNNSSDYKSRKLISCALDSLLATFCNRLDYLHLT